MPNKVIILTAKQASPTIAAIITHPKSVRRAIDVGISISMSIAALALTGQFNLIPLIIGGACGIVASSWYIANFLRIKLFMNGTGSFDISKITEYFKANSKFTEVRLGEFMDARKDMGFPHWKFDNVVIESVDGGAVVVAPLVHLRLLVQELQREGYKFQQDPKSSVRILI